MKTKILDQKGEGRYYVVIHDLRASKDDTRKPAFNICVYDTERVGGDWNDYIVATAADTEEEARKTMDKFYYEYCREEVLQLLRKVANDLEYEGISETEVEKLRKLANHLEDLWSDKE